MRFKQTCQLHTDSPDASKQEQKWVVFAVVSSCICSLFEF